MNDKTKKGAVVPPKGNPPAKPTLGTTPTKPVEAKVLPDLTPKQDQKPAPAGQDQKPVSAQDQKGAPAGEGKKSRKKSATHVRWEALENFKPEQTIKINPGNKVRETVGGVPTPKTGKGAKRFSYYKDGMTVAEYLKVTKDQHSVPNALAHADMRWDVAAGWITIS